jgi:hypothetical protein
MEIGVIEGVQICIPERYLSQPSCVGALFG